MEGVWRAESYTEDGVEFVPGSIQSFEADFDKLSDSKGDIQFKYIYDDGSTVIFQGNYVPNSTCNEMDITFKNVATFSMDFTYIGEKLNIEGNIDGYSVKIKLKRT